MWESLLLSVIRLFPGIYAIYGQEMRDMNIDTTSPKKISKKVQHQMMLPMPFFTLMGIPYRVGNYGVVVAALPSRIGRKTNTAFHFQFETGFIKTVELFIGCDG